MSFCITKSFELRCTHELVSETFEPMHGHNYYLEVTLASDSLNQETQWVESRDTLDEVVQNCVIKPFDKSHLNNHFKFTSGEYLVNKIFDILKNTKIGNNLKSVALQETSKNRFVRIQ